MLKFSTKQFERLDDDAWAETSNLVVERTFAETDVSGSPERIQEIADIVSCCRQHDINSREEVFQVTKAALTKGDEPAAGLSTPTFGAASDAAEHEEAWQKDWILAADGLAVLSQNLSVFDEEQRRF